MRTLVLYRFFKLQFMSKASQYLVGNECKMDLIRSRGAGPIVQKKHTLVLNDGNVSWMLELILHLSSGSAE